MSVLDQIIARFFGDDIFISYARKDGDQTYGATYAAALANRLAGDDFSCRLDRWSTEPGEKIPDSLRRALRRSLVLVVVGTRGAAQSDAVKDEITEFAKSRRPIIPIDVDGSLESAVWFPLMRGLPIEEIQATEMPVSPSEAVVSRVENSFGYTKKNRRLQISAGIALAVFVLLSIAGGFSGWKALEQAAAAREQTLIADQEQRRADREQKRADEEQRRASEEATRFQTARREVDVVTSELAAAEDAKEEAVRLGRRERALTLWGESHRARSSGKGVLAIHQLLQALHESPDSDLSATLRRDLRESLSKLRLIHFLSQPGGLKGATFVGGEDRILTWGGTSGQLWSVSSGQAIGTPLEHGSEIDGVDVSPEGDWAVTWSLGSAAIRVWSAVDGRLLSRLNHDRGVNGASFIQRLDETALEEAFARLPLEEQREFEMRLDQEIRRLEKAGSSFDSREVEILAGRFLPELLSHPVFRRRRTEILSWSADGTARLWNPRSGAEIERFEHPEPWGSCDRDAVPIVEAHYSPQWGEEGISERLLTLGSGCEVIVVSTPEGVRELRERRAFLWDVESGDVSGMLDDAVAFGLRGSFSGEGVPYTWGGGPIRLWSFEDGEIASYDPPGDLENLQVQHSIEEDDLFDSALRSVLWLVGRSGTNGYVLRDDGVDEAALWTLGHRRAVTSLEVLTRSDRILTSDDEGISRFWDLRSGRQLGGDLTHTAGVIGTSVAVEEGSFVSWSRDGTVRVWPLSGTVSSYPPLHHSGQVMGALSRPEASVVLSWDHEAARLWEVGETQGAAVAALVGADRRWILVEKRLGTLQLWDLERGQPVGKSLETPQGWDPESSGFAYSEAGQELFLWSSRKISALRRESQWWIFNSENGALVQSSVVGVDTFDGLARLRSLAEEIELYVVYELDPEALTPEDEDFLFRWLDSELEGTDESAEDDVVGPRFTGARFSPDGEELIATIVDGASGTAGVLTTEGRWRWVNEAAVTEDSRAQMRGAWLSASAGDGRNLLIWNDDAEVEIWNRAGSRVAGPFEQEESTLPVHRDCPAADDLLPRGPELSADGTLMLSWTTGQEWSLVQLIDTRDGATVGQIEVGSWIDGADLSRDGRRVLLWGDFGAELWDSRTSRRVGEPIAPLGRRGQETGKGAKAIPRCLPLPEGASFSPSEELAVGLDSSIVEIRRVRDGLPAGPPLEHALAQDHVAGRVLGVDFAEDERRVVTWTLDHRLYYWEVESGELLAPVLQHPIPIAGSRFSPDEELAVFWDLGGQAFTWNLATHQVNRLAPPGTRVREVFFLGHQGRALLWDGVRGGPVTSVGADLDAPLELLQLEVEVRTGTRFDAVGQRVLPLSATEYARYRSRYSEVAARHGSKCGYPESNLFLNVSSDARAAGSEAQIGEVFRDCSTCPEMVVIPVGQFVMGGAGDEAFEDERPQHEVEIGQSFAMGRFEITRAQYEEFVRDTGTEPSGCRYRDFLRYKMDEALSWRDPGFRQTDGDPAVCVSWEDAQRYVDWLSKQTGRPYRLPSEAEWEYAARGGSASPRYWGDSAVEGCSYANGADQTAAEAHRGLTAVSCRDSFAHTAPTGRYRANAFGLYDMLGNVWEWVEDCWNESYAGAPADGRPWLEGDCERRVQRGGSFLSQPVLVRVSGRDYADRTLRTYSWGFRVATTLK